MELALLSIACLLNLTPESTSQFTNHSTYDYIIIGGGSAGAALAGRLSDESVGLSILLIEAGRKPTDDLKFQSPASVAQLWGSAGKTDWFYKTVAQANACAGYTDKKCQVVVPKLLGGGSSINAFIYARGNKPDYDIWAEMGADGWSYDDVLPYFKKAEGCTIKENIEFDFHGVYGPLTVSLNPFATAIQQSYFDGFNQLGATMLDYHGKTPIGYSKLQSTIRNGRRCSTEKAYLRPAYGRSNLVILTDAFVTKITFDANKRATEVKFDYQGRKYCANARKEIIVSAGAYNGPKLLMLSGIGPKSHLESLGIKVISDLPVGQSLEDHPGTVGFPFTINTPLITPADSAEAEIKFKDGLGLFTFTGGEAVEFFKTDYEKRAGDYPDLEVVMISGISPFFQFESFNQKVKDYFKGFENASIITVVTICLHPKSKGQVLLKSSNPNDPPIIDYQYFSNDDDLKVVVEGLKRAIKLAQTAPMKKFDVQPLKNKISGCEQFELNSDDYLSCYVKTTTTTFFHQIGTCRMGKLTEPTTVVDPTLKVKGVTGLRVADTSVIPKSISGHTNAAAIMIGEKAADMILSDM